jgi:hypothetical protein
MGSVLDITASVLDSISPWHDENSLFGYTKLYHAVGPPGFKLLFLSACVYSFLLFFLRFYFFLSLRQFRDEGLSPLMCLCRKVTSNEAAAPTNLAIRFDATVLSSSTITHPTSFPNLPSCWVSRGVAYRKLVQSGPSLSSPPLHPRQGPYRGTRLCASRGWPCPN